MHKVLYKSLFVFLTILALSFSLSAQKKSRSAGCSLQKRSEILEQRNRFIQQELQLTSKEQEHLVRVLKNLDDKKFALWKEVRELYEKREKSGLTKEEQERFFDLRNQNKAQGKILEQEAMQELKKYISVEKLDKLEDVRRRFALRFAEEHFRKGNR